MKKQLDIFTSIINPEILHFDSIDSTNKYLLENDHPNGTVALADFQTAGRGRMTRKWKASKSEALLFSILLNENIREYHPSILSFITAIAVFEGLSNVYRYLPFSLKWPNDILANKKKICGILLESRSTGGDFSKIVIGIGINVNQPAKFFKQKGLEHGSSLLIETSKIGDRIKILESVLDSLEQNLVFASKRSEAEVLNKWKSFCPYIGKQVKLLESNKEHVGIFEDLDSEGGIILNQNGRKSTFYAADVSFDKEYL